MQMINWIDTFIAPIAWFITISQRAHQILTSPRAQQVYKAIVLFIGVLCIAIVLGIAKTIQISVLAASEAFIEALATPEESTEIFIVQKSESISQEPTEILIVQESESIVPDLRVRTLRKTATAKGIPNAGRMKKADLLTALSQTGGIPCQLGKSVMGETFESCI